MVEENILQGFDAALNKNSLIYFYIDLHLDTRFGTLLNFLMLNIFAIYYHLLPQKSKQSLALAMPLILQHSKHEISQNSSFSTEILKIKIDRNQDRPLTLTSF